MLMAMPHFLVHPLKFAAAIQRANLALIQGDPNALERDPQRSAVSHCCRELVEPTRHNSGPATLSPALASFRELPAPVARAPDETCYSRAAAEPGSRQGLKGGWSVTASVAGGGRPTEAPLTPLLASPVSKNG